MRRASWLGMLAGADFIKTSTGKVAVNATPPLTDSDSDSAPRGVQPLRA
ncbi:hypothetical protein [Streptomyces sp. NRRL WC-3604]